MSGTSAYLFLIGIWTFKSKLFSLVDRGTAHRGLSDGSFFHIRIVCRICREGCAADIHAGMRNGLYRRYIAGRGLADPDPEKPQKCRHGAGAPSIVYEIHSGKSAWRKRGELNLLPMERHIFPVHEASVNLNFIQKYK